ncbi:MAG: ABC transporter permease, partial [Muribaculaceae bacterium]|nr:ABC transporter permease [Muribaculaceae bacterium]
KIPPIIATMGMGYILETVSLMYNHHFAVFETCSILTAISRKKIFGLQIVIYIILALALVVMFLLKKTTYGKSLVAVGQNIEAAKLAGINTVRVETLTYIFSSVLASVGGMLIAARVGGAFLGMGDSYQMESVGAVVLGGTLISGGKAVPVGTLAGCVFLGLIMSTMQIAGFPQGAQNVAKGILIIAVILLGEINRRRQLSDAGAASDNETKTQEVEHV